MNPHHVTRFIGVMLIFSSSIIFLGPSILAQPEEEEELYGPCSPPDRLATSNGAAWGHGSTVAVTINPNDFPTTAERQAIEAAFTAWQNANTHSGVTFTFTTGTTDPNSTNTFYVNRGATQNGAATSVSNTGSPTTSGNITTHAATTIDPRVTADHAIASFMAHEIGHTFGLGDCFSCNTAASMMSPPQHDCNCEYLPCDTNQGFNNTHWGCPPLQQPRWCDEQKVNEYAADYPTPTPTPTPSPQESGVGNCNDWFDNDGDGLTDCEDMGCHNCCVGGCNQAMFDACAAIGAPYCVSGQCYTPVLVDVLGDGLKLTNAHNGILFNVVPGKLLRIAWTEPNSDDAWLILDRNGNGAVDSGEEMFGNATPQPSPPPGIGKNGFNALAVYDQPGNGGNGDGIIDEQDLIFSALRLWHDKNQNGISEPAELSRLTDLGLNSIGLDYKESNKTDAYGNRWMYRAKVKDKNDAQLGRWAWDVFLVSGY
jgi:hypothetical protein